MQGQTLVQIVTQLAGSGDTRPFLTLVQDGTPDRVLSYGELYRLQMSWSRRLVAAGVQPGQTVIVIRPHSEALYGALGGALLMGAVPAVYAFPSIKLSTERYYSSLGALLLQSNARLIVAYPELTPSLTEFLAEAGIAVPVIDALDVASITGNEIGAWSARPDDIAFLQYSSGTTGLKKGVTVTHRALLWQIHAYAKAIGLGASDVIASWLPLYHDMGLVACFMLPWLTRTPVVAMSPFSWVQRPEILLEKIQKYRATLCWQPNFAYLHLANRVESLPNKTWDVTSIRMFINCSEPITASAHARFSAALAPFGLSKESLASCYAMAENTFAVTNTPPGKSAAEIRVNAQDFEVKHRVTMAEKDAPSRLWVSSGKPLEGVVVTVHDKTGNSVSEGEIGEVAVAAACLFNGYHGNPDATREATRDGLFYTGDLGFIWGGEVFITGRKKDLIIVAGKNIYPQDIEEIVDGVLGTIAGRSVAFGVEDIGNGTEKIVVIAETSLIDRDEADKLRAEIAVRLNSTVEVSVDNVTLVAPHWLLKSTSGKISRVLNRQKYLSEFGVHIDNNVPPSKEKDAIMRVLHCVLSPSALAIPMTEDTRLISSGLLDSLALTTLLSAIEREWSMSLPANFLDAFIADDRVSTLRGLVLGATKTAGRHGISGNDWNRKSFDRFTMGDDRRKYQIAPQLADANRLGARDDPRFGRISTANYRSSTLNTDESGFRCTTYGDDTLEWTTFKKMTGEKGFILGNSVAFGVGVSADSKTCASLLNQENNGITWYNLALRRSSITQEFQALKSKIDCAPTHVVWLSGINDLKFFLVDMVNAITATEIDRFILSESMWWANYNKYKSRFDEVLQKINEFREHHDIKMIFALQPTTNWVEKKLTREEALLVNEYDCSFSVILRRILTSILTPLYGDYSAFLKKTSESNGMLFIDFNRHPAIFAADDWLFMDRLHLGDRGHAVIAHTISDMLQRGDHYVTSTYESSLKTSTHRRRI